MRIAGEKGRNGDAEVLARAVVALRRAMPTERLSERSRAAIVETALGADLAPAPPSGLWHAVRIAALAAVAALVMVQIPGFQKSTEPVLLKAAKDGNSVVFTITDGPGPHVVTRSTNPERFISKASTTVEDGRYRDLADSGPVLVFYRVD